MIWLLLLAVVIGLARLGYLMLRFEECCESYYDEGYVEGYDLGFTAGCDHGNKHSVVPDESERAFDRAYEGCCGDEVSG